jgi:hypothetical protein
MHATVRAQPKLRKIPFVLEFAITKVAHLAKRCGCSVLARAVVDFGVLCGVDVDADTDVGMQVYIGRGAALPLTGVTLDDLQYVCQLMNFAIEVGCLELVTAFMEVGGEDAMLALVAGSGCWWHTTMGQPTHAVFHGWMWNNPKLLMLVQAVRCGQGPILQALLSRTGFTGLCATHVAELVVEACNPTVPLDLLRMLVAAAAPCDLTTEVAFLRIPPLFCAVQAGNEAAARVLMAAGASPLQATSRGVTLVHAAAWGTGTAIGKADELHCVEAVKLALRLGGHEVDLDATFDLPDIGVCTVAGLVVWKDQPTLLRCLLDAGVSMVVPPANTLMDLALEAEAVDCVEVLRTWGLGLCPDL